MSEQSKVGEQGETVLLRPQQVAFMCGVTPRTISDWCFTGKLQAQRTIGGQYRIPQTEVDRLLNHTPAPPPRELTPYERGGFGADEEEPTVSDLPDLRTLFKQED